MKIGIFGGTFNPPHCGHIKICKHFSDMLRFDKLLIIPTFIPPHKQSQSLASANERVEMCKLAFDGIENAQISTIEIERGGKSYTVDTLTQIKNLYPDSELFFIMGTDMFNSFNKWYRWQDILSLCTICVARRENDEIIENLYPDYNDKILISETEPFVVSSSEIRERIKAHDSVDGILPEKVTRYINEKKVYNV